MLLGHNTEVPRRRLDVKKNLVIHVIDHCEEARQSRRENIK